MTSTQAATRVMIFLSEDDRVGHHGLHEMIVERARDDGMAGATVWRGIEGFGSSGRVRTSRFPDAAMGLPLVVEICDEPARIETFLGVVAELAPSSFVTREHVEMTRFGDQLAPSLDDPAPGEPHRS